MFQYIMADEFMLKRNQKGYEKFTSIAGNAYDIITVGRQLRSDINLICLTHSEYDDKSGNYKIKTIGKLLDEKITLQGLFTVVLYTHVEIDMKEKKTKYHFVTNKFADNMGNEIPAKSPVGMFPDILVPNDLGYVTEQANAYYQ